MKVKNLLNQPLELDFGKEVYRFNAREEKDIPDKYVENRTFKRNEKDLHVLVKPKITKEKASDTETEK